MSVLTKQLVPPLLIRAGIAAVKQWLYRPLIVKGRLMEVVTQVEVRILEAEGLQVYSRSGDSLTRTSSGTRPTM